MNNKLDVMPSLLFLHFSTIWRLYKSFRTWQMSGMALCGYVYKGVTLMEFFMAASLAVFLSVPVGPVGFAAGERLLLGYARDFVLIAAGCVVADVAWALATVFLMQFLPTFDLSWAYQLWFLWVAIGLMLVALGVVLYSKSPKVVSEAIKQHPFLFGFLATATWPTTFTGIFGAFGTAHMAGWLPVEMGERALVAMSLGAGTIAMWSLWWGGFTLLRYQQRWSVNQLALVVHRLMAVTLVIAGVGIALKPVMV